MARRNSILVSRTLYQIGVLTLITAIMWTLFGVFQAISKAPTKIEVEKAVLDPITPSFDQATLELLTSRQKIDLTLIPSPAPSEINVVETTLATPSATVETPQATTSATIDTEEAQ